MIPAVFYLGSAVCLMAWIVGLTRIGQHGPRMAHTASLIVMGLAGATIVAAFSLPRSHWALGSAGGGDGFGLIGLALFAAIGFGLAVVSVIVAEIVRAMAARRRKPAAEKRP